MDKMKNYFKKYWGILVAIFVCLGVLAASHWTSKTEKGRQRVEISKGSIKNKHLIASASTKHIKGRKRIVNHDPPGVMVD